jgi:DNA polymerase-1
LKTITVIDTFGFFFRNYYALPKLSANNGFPTGLLTGFINFIASLSKEYSSDYILFALDSKERNIRKEIDPNYKANRETPPEDLLMQLPIAIDWIKKMGFKEMSIDGYEADDIIASIVKFAKDRDMKVRIVSHDKDLYQLIDDKRVTIFDPMKKVDIDEEKCREKFGVDPSKIVDFLALVGDTSDNIPGVKGIGPKGASKLLSEFESIEDIYENIDKISNPRLKQLLIDGKERAFLSKKLATLHDDILQKVDLKELSFPKGNPILKIANEMLELNMKRLLQRAGTVYENGKRESNNLKFNSILLNSKEKLSKVLDLIDEDSVISFDTETTSLDALNCKIVGFSFAINEKEAYYVPIAHNYLGVGEQVEKEDAKEALKKIVSKRVVGQNLKFDFEVLRNNFGFEDLKAYGDTMIISWLLDSSLSAGLDNMAKRYFDYDMVKFDDVVKKGEDFSSVELKDATRYAAEDAWMTLKLYNFFQDKMDETLKKIATDVEYPFINTLINMEEAGIKADIDFLEELKEEFDKKISQITKDIYSYAQGEFNINSTKQLSSVLFEKLNLKRGKKTKSGYSTNEKVLNDLKESHPIIPLILEYRELYKLRSTYIIPLREIAEKSSDHRIHTTFLQTGTTTGRLSSKNPNLQNIPVRTEIGKRIREAFIAKSGYKLVSIDYSQIELRLLAHFSKDSSLLKAFKEDKDIHLETAKKLFGSERAKEYRAVAKSINFGLLYGMGSRKLSQTLGISQSEAKKYIESYFESFPTVKNYLDRVKESAKREGAVYTLIGRRRVFDYERANAFEKAAFERESVNTLFQGSAADLIKLSMNKIDRELDKNEGVMLLQIHDELIFEVREDAAKEYSQKAKEIMESIYTLNVPLKCSVSIGDSWGDLK